LKIVASFFVEEEVVEDEDLVVVAVVVVEQIGPLGNLDKEADGGSDSNRIFEIGNKADAAMIDDAIACGIIGAIVAN
jgi:hypothetical protein